MIVQSKISGGCSVCRGPGHGTCSGSSEGARASILEQGSKWDEDLLSGPHIFRLFEGSGLD